MTISLTDAQFDQLEEHLTRAGLHRKALFHDLLDHYYCLTTRYMGEGKPFEEASKSAYRELAPDGFPAIENQLQIFLHFNIHLRMNRILYLGAFVAAFGESMYVAFRNFHWPGASFMLMLACAALFFMVLPVWVIQFVQNRHTMRVGKRIRIIAGLAGIAFFGMGSAFKVLHWAGANVQLLAATVLFGFVFFPLFFWEQYRNSVRQAEGLGQLA